MPKLISKEVMDKYRAEYGKDFTSKQIIRSVIELETDIDPDKAMIGYDAVNKQYIVCDKEEAEEVTPPTE